MAIIAFTDGSSSHNGKKNCKSSCGVYIPGVSPRSYSLTVEEACELVNFKFNGKHSNNIGELMGILVALILTKDEDDVIIYSDSQYCINSITSWYKKWEVNSWMNSSGKPVANKELIKEILKNKKNTFFMHVKAHTKEPPRDDPEYFKWFGNNEADRLAGEAITKC